MSSFSYSSFDRTTSAASLTNYLIAAAGGAYVVFKALELLGYPVWLWLHQLTMALETSPSQLMSLLPGPFHSDSSDSEDNDRQPGMAGRRASTLSGVFGLGSGGLLGKGVSAVTGALSKKREKVPAGLGNWDNSCYQNSVIQGMASLPSLRDYLSKTTSGYRGLDAETTNGALFEMIDKLNNPENHGQHFWIKGKLKSMSTFQQQDAQEYYSKILDALDKEVQTASKSTRQSSGSLLSPVKSLDDLPDAIVQTDTEMDTADENAQPPEQPVVTPNPLDGLLAQRVGCIECGYTEGLSLIPFNCITVPLGRSWAYNIGDCLDEYTHLEYIEGVECAKCTLLKMHKTLKSMPNIPPGSPLADRLQVVEEVLEEEDFDDKTVIKKCNLLKKNWVKSTKSRQAVIARAPKSLVIHVNRSIFDEMTGAQYKNNARVMYPKVLDLGNWCLGSRPSNTQRPDDSIEEAWPRDPRQSMIGATDAEPTTTSPFQYSLKAAITHFGNHGSGHYVCYRQHPFSTKDEQEDEEKEAEHEDQHQDKHQTSEDQWWRLSDESVSGVPEDEALNQSNVFMLFYERVDPETTAPPPRGADPVDVGTSIAEPLPSIVAATVTTDIGAVDGTPTEAPLLDDDAHISPLSPLPLSAETEPLARAGNAPPTSPPDKKPSEADSVEDDSAASALSVQTHQHAPSEDTEMSEADTTNYDSEEAPSTQMTSDDDVDMDEEEVVKRVSEVQRSMPTGMPLMKTAGDVAPREAEEESAGLRMVSAT
jgi:ubiquitin carboxyl-terminal hydrolase 1